MGTNLTIDMVEDENELRPIVVDEDAPINHPTQAVDVVDEEFDEIDRLPKHAIRNEGGSITLPLTFPRTLTIKKNDKVREERYTQLLMHRLNGADTMAISATSEEMVPVVAIARSTKISIAVMKVLFTKMDAADINAASQVITHFLASGRRTGR